MELSLHKQHMFKPAVSSASVQETRQLSERSEKAEPPDPLSSHPEHHRGVCWPVLRHACWFVCKCFFQPRLKSSVRWTLNVVTYLRWLPGQIAADVPHPDIAPLPPCRPRTAFTLQLWHTSANTAFLVARNLTASYFGRHPQWPRFDLSAEFSTFQSVEKPDCSAGLGGRSTPPVHKHIPCHTCDSCATQEMLSVWHPKGHVLVIKHDIFRLFDYTFAFFGFSLTAQIWGVHLCGPYYLNWKHKRLKMTVTPTWR